MRLAPRIWAFALAAVGLGLTARPVDAAFVFTAISNNNSANVAAGEAQLQMTIEAVGTDRVMFCFTDNGSVPMSITEVYFDGTGLLSYSTASFTESPPAVDFSSLASPANLPEGNNAVPPFVADYSAGASGTTAGVNPGEIFCVTFNLASGKGLSDVLGALNSGDLRVGLHVQSINAGSGDSSESFINSPVPAPTGAVLLASAVPVLVLRRFRRKAAA